VATIKSCDLCMASVKGDTINICMYSNNKMFENKKKGVAEYFVGEAKEYPYGGFFTISGTPQYLMYKIYELCESCAEKMLKSLNVAHDKFKSDLKEFEGFKI